MRKKREWSESEIGFLTKNCGLASYEEIGRVLGVSGTAVRMKAVELGIHRAKGHHTCDWTDEKIQCLREKYPTEPLSDIALRVGFSPLSVKRKAEQLGLSRSPDYDVRNFNNRFVKNYVKR